MSPTRPLHGQPVTLAAAPRAALATELLQLCERFFTNASPAVLAELRAFLIAEGVHPSRLGCSPTASASPPTIPGRVNDPCCCAAGRRAAESADAAVPDVGGQR